MDKLAQVLEKLADKLGVTAAHLWQVLINQARIIVIQDIVILGMFFLLGLAYYFWVKSFRKRYEKDPYLEVEPMIIIMTGIVLSIATVGLLTVCIPEIITCVYNPEYYALQEIVKHLN